MQTSEPTQYNKLTINTTDYIGQVFSVTRGLLRGPFPKCILFITKTYLFKLLISF